MKPDDYMSVSDIPGVDDMESEATVEPFELTAIESDIDKRDDDIKADYSKVRQTMDFQQQMLMEAAKIALESARNGEHPRQMEVFTTIMAQLTTLNTKIITIQKDVKEIAASPTQGNSQPTGETSITAENVFIGSAAELMNQVGSQQDEQDKHKEKVVNRD